MASTEALCSRWSQGLLSVLRIMTGFLFAEHGAEKLFGFLAPPNAPLPHLFSFMGLAGVLEFFGGLAVLLGLFTRPAAFILSGQMAVAYFLAHASRGFWPVQNKGELAVLYCFVFLYLSAAGAGALSLDRLLEKRSQAQKGQAVSRSG